MHPSFNFPLMISLTMFLPSLLSFSPRLLLLLSSHLSTPTCTHFTSLFSFEPQNCITPDRRDTRLARNIHIQQALQPVDPSLIPGLMRPRLDSEGDEDGPLAPPLPPSQPSELTQPSSTGNPAQRCCVRGTSGDLVVSRI